MSGGKIKTFDKLKLSKSAVDGLSAPGIYPDAILTGFRVLVSIDSRTGKTSKTYQMRSRVKGEKNPITCRIGLHRDKFHPDGYTEPEARDNAEKIRRQMREGINPNELFRQEKQKELAERADNAVKAKAQSLTLRELFEDWKTGYTGAQSTIDLYDDVLNAHLSDWFSRPVIELKVDEIRKRYTEIAQRTISSANNVFRALRLLINWAVDEYSDDNGRQVFSFNPVTKALKNHWREVPARDDIIRIDDLKGWFAAVESISNPSYKDYFIFLLLTGLRKSEAAHLEWKNVEMSAGQFTVKDTKNGRNHTLPISSYVGGMLASRANSESGKFVFPGYGGYAAIKDVRHYQEEIQSISGVIFTPHTLRRTFATTAGRLVSSYVVKALLNHYDKADVTQAHYQAHRVEELRQPLQEIEDFILIQAGKIQFPTLVDGGNRT